MEDESVLPFYGNRESLDHHHVKESNSTRTKSDEKFLKKSVDKILIPPPALPAIENEEESVDLQGEGRENFIPSNIIDVWFRLQVLLRLKMSGPTITSTEPSNLMDDFYKRGELKNEQQYRNALDEVKSK